MAKTLAVNKKVFFDYSVKDTLECGIELRGNEVKSIRNCMTSIKEAWISVENRELIIHNMHITPWTTANKFDVDERRDRRLLAHKSEILKLKQQVERDGFTIMPLEVHLTNGKIKLLIGLCEGKHNYDKRAALKDRDVSRKLQRRDYK